VETDEDAMIYGIPLIIGARKGFPNLNEFSVQTYVQVERRLVFTNLSARTYVTNQQYVIGISNVYGLESWNSYTNRYPRRLEMRAGIVANVQMQDENNYRFFTNYYVPVGSNILGNNWPGLQFKVPVQSAYVTLENAAFFNTPAQFRNIMPNPGFDLGPGYSIPHWTLTISNRLLYYVVDTDLVPPRVVDFVSIDDFTNSIDVSQQLINGGTVNPFGTSPNDGDMWDTNRLRNSTLNTDPTMGVFYQIEASLGKRNVNWNNYSAQIANKTFGIDIFRVRMGLTPLYAQAGTISTNQPRLFQAPFSPMRKFYHYASWQVNDPLVHYVYRDYYSSNYTQQVFPVVGGITPTNSNMGFTNDSYMPWGSRKPGVGNLLNNVAFNRALKDPMVRGSDDWDFPSDEMPSIGWLGKIHRGTPWQSIYFKSDVVDSDLWESWAYDRRTHPTNDWRLADMFFTAPHPNALRGQLSVNQTNLAAWSAVLSGVMVLSNNVADDQLTISNEPPLVDITVEPASWQLQALVDAINGGRTNRNQYQNAYLNSGVYTNISSLLAIPELTVRSPFLNTATDAQMLYGLNDAAYERIPQQILSLLKVGEARYVIYAWGQSLRPAPRSITFGAGALNKLCTNYVISGEVATRTVIRVEGRASNPRIVTESFNLLPPE
jgi:hypothetical protein